MESIVVTLCLLVFFTNVLLIAVLRSWVVSKKIDYKAAVCLQLVLVAFGLQMLEFIFVQTGFYRSFPSLLMAFDPLILLWPFFVSNYLLAINRFEGLKTIYPVGVHWLIPLGFLVSCLPFMFAESSFKVDFVYTSMLRVETIFTPKDPSWPWLLTSRSEQLFVLGMTGFVYWLRTHIKLKQTNTKNKELRRYTSLWQLSFLVISLLMLGFSLFGYSEYTNPVMSICLLTFLWSLTYYFLTKLKHPKSPPQVQQKVQENTQIKALTSSDNIGQVYPPNIEEEGTCLESQVIFDLLDKHVREGAYQDPSLSLAKLSEVVGFRVQLCSKAINEASGANFYDWVNAYRVAEATELLKKGNANIDFIYYRVGFKSKSTFYNAFKKIEGMTPGQFKKQQTTGGG